MKDSRLNGKRNLEVKEMMLKAKIPQWLVAEKLEMSVASLARLLTRKLTDEQRQSIIEAIESIKKEGGADD